MIAPSTPLCRWQVSDVLATRYDLPDQPMDGEMDAAFFLTRDTNFIPHEYPCRTAFAAFQGLAPSAETQGLFKTLSAR